MAAVIYGVVLERDETGAWLARVPSVPGCHTYGRTLEQARRRIREALELWVGDAPSSELRFDIRLPAGIGEELRVAQTARKLATLRSFYKFCLKRSYVGGNPLSTIRTAKQEKRLPKFLEEEEVKKLLEAPDINTLLGARDRSMLETMYSTGVRVSELVDLNLADVDFVGEALHIRGKGKKARITPIAPTALE